MSVNAWSLEVNLIWFVGAKIKIPVIQVTGIFISWRRDSVEYARNEACETINHPLCGCATEVIQRSHLSL